MFIGHYSAAFAARALEPRLPLWQLFIAAQLVDIVWVLLVLSGIERIAMDPSLPSNPLDLQYVPYTHSLVAAFGWSLLAGLAVRALASAGPRRSSRVGLVAGFVVFSHWWLDWVSHRPDLPVYGDSLKLGLGLWSHPGAAFALEVALVAGGVALYLARVRPTPCRRNAVLGLGAVLVALQTSSLLGPVPDSANAFVVTALGLFVVLAWLASRVEDRRISA